MSQPPNLDRATLRSLSSSLAGAPDGQIARIVAMIDALPDRGEADALIAPLRGRLSHIVPVRRLNFTRLLFQPLDPVIVAPAEWRPGGVSIPRSALAPVAAVVRDGLGPAATAIDSALAALPAPSGHDVALHGAAIWSRAAAILAAGAPPRDWQAATGLPLAHYPPLAARMVMALRHADTLQVLTQRRLDGKPFPDVIIRQLLSAASGDPGVWSTLLSVLLARVGQAADLLRLAEEIALQGGRGRLNQEPAIEFAVRGLETLPARTVYSETIDIVEAADELERAADMMDGMHDTLLSRPGPRQQVQQIRAKLDAACKDCFEKALNDTLFKPLPAVVDDEASAKLEASARRLRRLEAAGRRFGSGEHYDAVLRAGAARLCAMEAPGLTRIDRLRMTEIMLGANAALPLLGAAPPRP